jgi:hypothetical protein
MLYRRFSALAIMLVMAGAMTKLVACGDGTSAPGESFVVGPGGGTFTADGVQLAIPAGAVASDVTITVSDDPSGAPSGFTVDGKVYRFAPEGLTFASPIAVSFPTPSTESIYWTVAGNAQKFESLATTVDGTHATAQITHFSSGFLGLPADGVTCTVTRRVGNTCTTTTTVETPTFAFAPSPNGPLDLRSTLRVFSAGLEQIVDGPFILLGNSGHTNYGFSFGGTTAQAVVSRDTITSFKADGARLGETVGVPCVHPPQLIEVHCRGGSSVQVDASAPPPVDSGATDAGAPVDASTHDSGIDCPVWDGGTQTLLTMAPTEPIGIAVKGGFAYYTERGSSSTTPTGTITRVPISGGTPTVLATAQFVPVDLTLDDTSIYWVNAGSPNTPSFSGSLMSMPIGGGSLTTLASSQNNPSNVVVHGTSILWATEDALKKAALDGTSPSTLMTPGAYYGLAANSTTAFFTFISTGGPNYMQKIGSVRLDGTNPATLVQLNQEVPKGMAIDDTSVYWANVYTGDVMTAGLNGSGAKALASGLTQPYRVAVDRCYVYWVDHDGVAKVSLSGGPLIRLVSMVGTPGGMTIDDTSIYWTLNNGPVYRLTPK